jgi:hypothetical protein
LLGTITLPVRVTASNATITNSATVSNPGDTNTVDNTDPAVIVVDSTPPPSPFNLSLKKYINTIAQDAQTNATAVAFSGGNTFNYVLVITNNGPQSVTGTTTVTDTLPAQTTLTGTISAPNWTCASAGQSISCTTTATPASGATFSQISLPVRISPATTDGYYTNSATVSNPGDTNTVDNTDPAVIVVGNPPPPGTAACVSLSAAQTSSDAGSLRTSISCV